MNAAHEGALRAALVPQFTPRRWRRFLDRGGDPAWLGNGGASMLSSRLGIGRLEAAKLARALKRARPDSERTRAAGAGVSVVAWGEAGYAGVTIVAGMARGIDAGGPRGRP